MQDIVKKMSGKDPNVSVNPDEVVALGAAVQVCVAVCVCVWGGEGGMGLQPVAYTSSWIYEGLVRF